METVRTSLIPSRRRTDTRKCTGNRGSLPSVTQGWRPRDVQRGDHKAVVSGKRIIFPVTVRSRNTFKCSCSVTTTSVTSCTSVGTGECTVKGKLEVGLRLLRLGIRICGLTNEAFTSSTSCSAQGHFWNASQFFCFLRRKLTKGYLDLFSVWTFPD